MEVEAREALGEAAMRVSAQLYQQEAGPPAQPVRSGRLGAGAVPGHVGPVYRAP
jgi:hypothetical protein